MHVYVDTKLDGQYYAGTCFICWLFTCSRYPDHMQVPYGGIVVDSLDAHERLAHGPPAASLSLFPMPGTCLYPYPQPTIHAASRGHIAHGVDAVCCYVPGLSDFVLAANCRNLHFHPRVCILLFGAGPIAGNLEKGRCAWVESQLSWSACIDKLAGGELGKLPDLLLLLRTLGTVV